MNDGVLVALNKGDELPEQLGLADDDIAFIAEDKLLTLLYDIRANLSPTKSRSNV